MNVEQMHAVLKEFRTSLTGSNVVPVLNQLVQTLEQAVANPGHGPAQDQVSASREQLLAALEASDLKRLVPSQAEALEELGLGWLLPAPMAAAVEDAFVRNQVTLSTAQAEMTDLQARVNEALGQVTNTLAAFAYLGVPDDSLVPSEFEVGVLIPRPEVDNSLDGLGKEFSALDRLLQPFNELTGNGRPPLELRAISSSNFGAFVTMASGAAAAFAFALDKVLDMYKKYLDIRVLKQGLLSAEVSPEVLTALDDDTTGRVTADMKLIVDDVMARFDDLNNADTARKNELRVNIEYSVKELTRRIDAGFSFHVRVGDGEVDESEADESEETHRQIVADRQDRFHRLDATGAGILSLESGNGVEPSDTSSPGRTRK